MPRVQLHRAISLRQPSVAQAWDHVHAHFWDEDQARRAYLDEQIEHERETGAWREKPRRKPCPAPER